MHTYQQLSSTHALCNGISAISYTLFMPLNYNSGHRIQQGKLTWALNEIVRHTGGLTKFAPGIGLWVSPNAIVYRDRVLPVQIITAPEESTEVWFTRFAAQLAVLLEQECIFLVAQPLSVINGEDK